MPAPTLTLDFDLGVYRLAAIKKAAYRFGDRAFVEIQMPSSSSVSVSLTPKRLIDNAEQLAGEFRNEVLDQDLRETIAEETQSIRNLLMAQAFSATALLDPVGESGDPASDPLQIRGSEMPAKRHPAGDVG